MIEKIESKTADKTVDIFVLADLYFFLIYQMSSKTSYPEDRCICDSEFETDLKSLSSISKKSISMRLQILSSEVITRYMDCSKSHQNRIVRG